MLVFVFLSVAGPLESKDPSATRAQFGGGELCVTIFGASATGISSKIIPIVQLAVVA